jgi:hypothetical protein
VNGVRIVLERLAMQAGGSPDPPALEGATGLLAVVAARVRLCRRVVIGAEPSRTILAPHNRVIDRHPADDPDVLLPEAMDPRDRNDRDDRAEVVTLLGKLKAALPQFQVLLDRYNGQWEYEDRVYRFCHASFKVCDLQVATASITAGPSAFDEGRACKEERPRVP